MEESYEMKERTETISVILCSHRQTAGESILSQCQHLKTDHHHQATQHHRTPLWYRQAAAVLHPPPSVHLHLTERVTIHTTAVKDIFDFITHRSRRHLSEQQIGAVSNSDCGVHNHRHWLIHTKRLPTLTTVPVVTTQHYRSSHRSIPLLYSR